MTNQNSNNVSVMDATLYMKVTTIEVGACSSPNGLAVDANNDQIWVANFLSNNVSVINASTFVKITTLTVGTGPNIFSVAINPPSL
ncbi:hypothetical protein LW858_30515 (plasmid) [Bacillus cereus]|uniref:YncE family protein n=1 Tax=Bacillus cereus TaxID=1396 RepID=UPI001F3766FB|nr:hypothetical protein [Bacillus cereus]UIJ69815.1 hypothetical protein LW858_30515 [Bacillus cereus]